MSTQKFDFNYYPKDTNIPRDEFAEFVRDLEKDEIEDYCEYCEGNEEDGGGCGNCGGDDDFAKDYLDYGECYVCRGTHICPGCDNTGVQKREVTNIF